MASNGGHDSFAPETILAALTTMRGGEPDKKKAAMDYLGKFQKSVRTSFALAAAQGLDDRVTNASNRKMHGRRPSRSSNRAPMPKPHYSQRQH